MFAAEAAAAVRAKSPTALKIALAQIRAGAALSFQACMQTEFRIVSRIVHGHDFYEGVRAVIIDRDSAPCWQPAKLADVADTDVASHFAPLGDDELVLP
jgi:enoyl-CoA hydratase